MYNLLIETLLRVNVQSMELTCPGWRILQHSFPMKKGCMIAAGVGLVLLLILSAIIYFVFQLTAPITTAGEKFLNTLGTGATEAAYNMASASLRASQTQEDFTRAVKAYGLNDYQSASWANRKITNDRGLLEGTATTKTGGAVPLTIEMINEGGTWKVLTIKGPQAGASTGPIINNEPTTTTPTAPPAAEAGRMALVSMLAFNAAIQSQSFDTFYLGIAKLWQEQITAAKLLDIFQSFIDAKIDLAGVKDVSPIFATAPAINDDGVLLLEGYYPTAPKKVYFKLKYVNEDQSWKLIGVNVKGDE